MVLLGICLAQPLFAQNLLQNPGFEEGLAPWVTWGDASIAQTTDQPRSGNNAAVVTDRTQNWQGTVQNVLGVLQDGNNYAVSAWVRVSGSSPQPVSIFFAQGDDEGERYFGLANRTVQPGAWVQISDVFSFRASGTVTRLDYYIQGPEAGVDLYVDDTEITLLPGDWVAEANARINQIRKSDLQVNVRDANGNSVAGAEVRIRQTRRDFPIGTTMAYSPLTNNENYRQYIIDHFNWGVHENEAKWYANEANRDIETYSQADAMLDFAEANDIEMRGHTIFWAPEQWQPDWVPGLSNQDLQAEVEERLESVVGHFDGRFQHWDVNNEMLHGSFFQDRLGPDIRKWMFERTRQLDPDVKLFVNDFNIISGNEAYDYVDQVQQLLDEGAPIDGIGVQGHYNENFSPVDPLQLQSRLDRLAQLDLPIWVTEFDVVQPDEDLRADALETFFRSAFSHPSVEGIILWGFWAGSHWKGPDAALVDSDWTVNAAGQRFEALLAEWTSNATRTTNAAGRAQARVFHGDYEIEVLVDGHPATVRNTMVSKDKAVSVLNVELDFEVEDTGGDASRGMYYDRAKDGHGIDLQKVGDNWFLVLYTYHDDGTPVWYLAVAPLEDDIFNADLLSFSYVNGVFAEEGAVGSIQIDFNDAAASPACNDGVDRSNARSLAAANVTYQGQSAVPLCFEPLVAANGVPDENYTGHWWGTAQDEGWGMTAYFQGENDEVEFVVLYYYDGAGNPRWGLGVASEPGANASLDLLNFSGYCLGCPVVPTQSASMGVLQHWFDSLNQAPASGLLSVDIDYPGPEGGNWLREEVYIERLSDAP